jgi:hypothetical protein
VSRLWALLIGLGFIVATLAPTLHDAPFEDDSYPFSTYPMFSRKLSKRVIVFAEGVGRRQAVRLGPEFVANDEPMQAQRTLRLAANGGDDALRKLCQRIAERVAVAPAGELSDLRRVRIVRGTFDPIRYFEVDAAPESSQVLAECRVRRARR